MNRKTLYDPSWEHDSCGVGFVANIDGTKTHRIVREGITILKNLVHRGAIGGDLKTGDGCGILTQLPHAFFREEVRVFDIDLPPFEEYGIGMFFLPVDESARKRACRISEQAVSREGGEWLGWRDVPSDPSCLGKLALEAMPSIRQGFVRFPGLCGDELERKLYVVRKCMESDARDNGFTLDDYYVCSLSCRTLNYKGMFVAPQLDAFYPDLRDERYQSALALVHQRYSTNTFPSWNLAQPFRYCAHNGEINTLRGNVNKMRAREGSLSSPAFKEDIRKLFPVGTPGASDSAIFDNAFELLALGGRSLEHSVMMMVPEAFGSKFHISQDKRAFYEYHTSIMEPWDGPAAIAFTNGTKIGAILDRNGLRPARYVITKSGRIVLASEVGVLDIDPADVREKGRLAPGKMILADLEQKRILKDNEIKATVSRRKPYRKWLEDNRIELKGLFQAPRPFKVDPRRLKTSQRLFGYTLEELKMILSPMAENAQEPVGSMGNDTPLAVLSKRPQLLYCYFKQLFAQVTNPPIDPYRENLVMSLMSYIGRERNLLEETPEHCKQLKLMHPVLTNDDMEKLKRSNHADLRVAVVPIVFEAREGMLKPALDRIRARAEQQVDAGASILVLSDRDAGKDLAPVPALLAASSVHHDLIRKGKRQLTGLVLESAEVRDVMHFATLIGYGASAVNPYLALETLSDLLENGALAGVTSLEDAINNYVTAVKKGLLKILSKMGISTIRSYRGAQIFEAVGLHHRIVDEYFPGTPSRIGGIGLAEMEREILLRHEAAFSGDAGVGGEDLESGGQIHYRDSTEQRVITADVIRLVQKAVRENDGNAYREFSKAVNDKNKKLCTLRGLFEFKKRDPVPLEEVEPVESIVRRFVTSAMSFGSISKEAHESMAIAMNRLGASSNSGEGGEEEERFTPRPGGDWAMSAVKQVASGRFGVTSHYLVNARELQIKMAQGAKPGEGGQLPGHKVDRVIAKVRHSTPGVMLISPPPHHDIYSIEDLAQLIYDLKNANPSARVSVKLVSEVGVGTVAAGVAKGRADMVLISGHDGGTGASPISSIKYAGIPWEIGLAETQQTLVRNRLRDKIRVQVDGKLLTGRDVVIAALLGAEEFGFGTIALITLGCIMMRKCHLNTCPVGVATQDERLRRRFRGKPDHLVHYMLFLAAEIREIMAALGVRRFDDLVGRVDLLSLHEAVHHWKSRGLDFGSVLVPPEVPGGSALRCLEIPRHDFSQSLDPRLIEDARAALDEGKAVSLEYAIRNSNRTVGAMLSSHISRQYGAGGLPQDTLHCRFTGSAGQSFAAFLASGVTFELEGDANDYFCKGLSGGRVIVYPSKLATFRPQHNIITGNVNLFGATAGEVYIHGMAGERFAVRNSGATAVVEGVGDHGCEYMTGGVVVVLGTTGINFAAGMSGGIAFVLDESQLFDTRCNLEMVNVEPVHVEADRDLLRSLIEKHVHYTGSAYARSILENWSEMLPLFVKVMPIDYKKALERIRKEQSRLTETATMTEEVSSHG